MPVDLDAITGMPWLEFTRFKYATIESHPLDNKLYWSSCDNISENTIANYNVHYIGSHRVTYYSEWWHWAVLLNVDSPLWKIQQGMNRMWSCGFKWMASIITRDTDEIYGAFGVDCEILKDSSQWNASSVNGKYYDGVSSQWSAYQIPREWYSYTYPSEISPGTGRPEFDDLPEEITHWFWAHLVSERMWDYQYDLIDHGVALHLTTFCWNGAPNPDKLRDDGDIITVSFKPLSAKAYFCNPIVNTLSRTTFHSVGGETLTLTGLAFQIPTADRDSFSIGPFNATNYVDRIYFQGLSGQGSYVLKRNVEFTVDSNTQITITAMPAMLAGRYQILLDKYDGELYNANESESGHAGDWRTDADGKATQGSRFIIEVYDTLPEPTPGPRGRRQPYYFIKTYWKKKSDNSIAERYYAPIDARSTLYYNTVTNGAFEYDADGWSFLASTILTSVAGGIIGNCIRITSPWVGAGYAYQRINGITIGKEYQLQFWFKKGTASGGYFKFGTTANGSEITSWVNLADAAWTLRTYNWTATTDVIYITFGLEEGLSKTGYFDQIMFFEAPIFYDGRVLDCSNVTRAVNDRTGLYTVSDFDVTLANADCEFSKMLAEYILKNQVLEIFYGWIDFPNVAKEYAFSGIVDDYELQGDVFHVRAVDGFQKYFQARTPRHRVSKEDYPNCRDEIVGRVWPEVLGDIGYVTSNAPGAVEAICVDITTFKYLAAAGTLHAIINVYSDGALVGPANYAIQNGPLGETYIVFTADQAEAKITYNPHGYSLPAYDSPSGFIENPSYILLYYLLYIANLPSRFIDLDSFDVLAAQLDTTTATDEGQLILAEEKVVEEIVGEQLYGIGAFGWRTKEGKFKVEKKDISDFTASLTFFSQVDLFGHPQRIYNLNSAVNKMKVNYGYMPAPGIYYNTVERKYQASIDDFEAELEDTTETNMPWMDDLYYTIARTNEELVKRAYGDWEVSISIPFTWLDELDIVTNFKLQDMFAVSLTGAGGTQYCYIKSLTMNLNDFRLEIIGADLSWMLAQYCCLGSEANLAANWSGCSQELRYYYYLCNGSTGRFADGVVGKKLIDENLI